MNLYKQRGISAMRVLRLAFTSAQSESSLRVYSARGLCYLHATGEESFQTWRMPRLKSQPGHALKEIISQID